jgi:hypothetical protein
VNGTGPADPDQPQSAALKLFVENKLANDGAEHLIEVGVFDDYAAVARAAYVHMNGPFEDDEPPARTFEEMAARIREVVGPDNSIFRGLAEDGEPHTFYLEATGLQGPR